MVDWSDFPCEKQMLSDWLLTGSAVAEIVASSAVSTSITLPSPKGPVFSYACLWRQCSGCPVDRHSRRWEKKREGEKTRKNVCALIRSRFRVCKDCSPHSRLQPAANAYRIKERHFFFFLQNNSCVFHWVCTACAFVLGWGGTMPRSLTFWHSLRETKSDEAWYAWWITAAE